MIQEKCRLQHISLSVLQLQRVPTTSILKFYIPVSFPVVEKVSRVEEVGGEESGLTLEAGGEEIGMLLICTVHNYFANI